MKDRANAMRVGFIGLGVMGLPMLESLAEKGDLDLLAFDHAAEPLRRLDAHPSFGGSLRFAPPAEFAGRAIVVTTLLAGGCIRGAAGCRRECQRP